MGSGLRYEFPWAFVLDVAGGGSNHHTAVSFMARSCWGHKAECVLDETVKDHASAEACCFVGGSTSHPTLLPSVELVVLLLEYLAL